MLPPEHRLGDVLKLIHDSTYFTLVAGRQTGKTTSLRWLVKHLNGSGEYRALWLDLQTAREQPEVKLRRDTHTEQDALEQLHGYLEQLGLDHGWLVLFDLRSTLGWQEKLATREVEYAGKRMTIVGC